MEENKKLTFEIEALPEDKFLMRCIETKDANTGSAPQTIGLFIRKQFGLKE